MSQPKKHHGESSSRNTTLSVGASLKKASVDKALNRARKAEGNHIPNLVYT